MRCVGGCRADPGLEVQLWLRDGAHSACMGETLTAVGGLPPAGTLESTADPPPATPWLCPRSSAFLFSPLHP